MKLSTSLRDGLRDGTGLLLAGEIPPSPGRPSSRATSRRKAESAIDAKDNPFCHAAEVGLASPDSKLVCRGVTDARGTDWTRDEIDLIVADYFDMLHLERSGQPYVKAARNDALQKLIPRNRKSIEFKHCNISAVLVRLGIKPIPGYRPLANFQHALIDGVERYLTRYGEPVFAAVGQVPLGLAEPPSLFIGPPPSPTVAVKETEPLRRLVRKFDPAERDARNRSLGRRGEELIFLHEREQLGKAGRDDLARKVEWTSEEWGDGAGYDIRSYTPDGRERLIEVKTTNGLAMTPFFLSENERAFSEERPDAFRLLRLYDFAQSPAAFELEPPLETYLTLSATTYRASF